MSFQPVYNLLEGQCELLVVNAQHMKAVPGRKTDTKDAEWIADLLAHGLLSASFIPSAPQRELRELTRYRVRLTEERSREVNRLQKTLEDTNLKLGDVVSDVMGKAAQLILQAVVEGESDPVRLASLAVGRVQASQQQLERALTGKVTAHHRFLLGQHLALIKHLDEAIRRVTEEIAHRFTPPEPPAEQEHLSAPTDALLSDSPEATAPSDESAALSWQEAIELIDQVTGISQRVAQGLLAEIGIKMDQFPSAKHPWPRGSASVRAIMRAQASDSAARLAKATPTLVNS